MRKLILEPAAWAAAAGFAALLIIADVSAVAEPQPAPAATRSFDGKWVINASTSSFFCPVRSKELTAVVGGGKVLALWGLPGNPEASGAVAPDGSVSIEVRLASLGVTATIDGKITGKSGQGGWSSTSMLCSKGSWRAAINS